ncbi:ATP-dependent helicase fft2 [Penicillium macrosclerotiorum]|uniref:ATP-dependent helicase fft2 n=1 Tax=Penicillium macrosclerotiorum TaxID=303699 RepID=UPI002547E874|nr:ATP-dependent helicase fft2 [Penicillium macrosclerotiorum]KAJ5692570.1 ATP-dependent helicase fft2 [Penicillium macrosclerotiorum]
MDDLVPDTPVRNKKPAPGTPNADEHETIATLPAHVLSPSQQLTQPTQLIELPYSRPNNSIVQVAASSPTAPVPSPPRRVPQGGLLSSLMAPSGTHFRPPSSTVRPAKRTPNFDMDDGPTYRGGSSDDDENRIDIKPSMFEKSARSPEKDKVVESPVRGEGPMSRFKEITLSAMYDPNTAGTKRSADQMSPAENAKGVAMKRARQDGPSRAQPVTAQYLTVQDIVDFRVRVKVERILKIMPDKSVQACADALMRCNGNYDRALEFLARADGNFVVDIESSDDELSTGPTITSNAGPTAKQNIKARGTIHDKWASMNIAASQRQHEEVKPRGRLMRGPRNRDSVPTISIESDDSPPQKKAGRLQKGRRRDQSQSASPEAVLSDSEDSDVQDIDSSSGGLHDKVLRFFNTCNVHDLADIASVPEETAKLITSHRPFSSLDEVRSVSAPVDPDAKPKGKGRPRKAPKPIGDKIVDKCMDMWTGYMAIDALVAECEALGRPVAEEMKKWGVDLFGKREGDFELVSMGSSHDSGIATPSSSHQTPDEDSDDEIRPVGKSRKSDSKTQSRFISQPAIMADTLEMKNYQIVGINWLALLFEKQMSCILADDMGLGKTCQVIAFLAHLYEKDIRGPHLVVVPASTIENWLREFKKFCPTLTVMPYYANQNERAEIREQIEDNPDSINVVITTYTIARNKVDNKFLRDMDFTVCVYDEGHVLKNHDSQIYDKLIRIRARFRLLLTGTPLQNNLQELASLLGFILPKVFREHKEDLHAVFSNKAKTDDESHATLLSAQRIERAKSMLKPFVLRRKKHQVIDLPAKHSRVQYCELKPSQHEIYNFEKEQVRQLLEDRAAGVKTGSKSANILMKLRQAAIHPLLARRHYTDAILKKMAKSCLKEEKWAASNPAIIEEELQPYNDFECHKMCIDNPASLGKFKLKNEEWMDSGKIDQLRTLLTGFIANGDRTLIFSQFTMVMDILENVLETLRIEFVRLDGRTNVEDRQTILDTFYEREDIPVFLLSTKAGGAGINLACANKVIIFDSSFNPQEDVQAENRAHRVGQIREVEVIRFVTRGTIEEQIYALGQTKLALDHAVAGDDDVGSKKTEEVGMKTVESMMLADMHEKGVAEPSAE